jgi:hypothetical protein
MGGSALPERMEEYQQHAKYKKNILVYDNSCAKWTPTTAVAIHQLHNIFSTFLRPPASFCGRLRLPSAGTGSCCTMSKTAIITQDIGRAAPFPSLASSSRSCSCRCVSLGTCGLARGCSGFAANCGCFGCWAWMAGEEEDWAVADVGAPQMAVEAVVPSHQWRLRVLAPLHPACMWQITAWLELQHVSNASPL